MKNTKRTKELPAFFIHLNLAYALLMEPPPTNTLHPFQSGALLLVILEGGIAHTAYV